MKKYLGGYANVDLTSDTIYNDLLNLKNVDKTILLYDTNETKPYFIDTIVYDTNSIVITKGGKTITIANDNTITSSGDIQPSVSTQKYRLHIKQHSEGESTLFSDIICEVDINTINSYATLLNYLKDKYKSVLDYDLNEYSRNVLTAYGYMTTDNGTTSIFGLSDYFEDDTDNITILSIDANGVTFGDMWLTNDGLTFEYLE